MLRWRGKGQGAPEEVKGGRERAGSISLSRGTEAYSGGGGKGRGRASSISLSRGAEACCEGGRVMGE